MQDALATLTYLRQQEWVDPERVALWGAGTGGTVALLAAAADPRLKAAAALLAPTDTAAFTTALAQQAPPLAEAITNAVGATPAQDSDAYRRRSPIHAAARIRAAVLAIYAAQDALVPPTRAKPAAGDAEGGTVVSCRSIPAMVPPRLSRASLAMIRFLNETLRNTPATGSRRSCLLRCMDSSNSPRPTDSRLPVSADLFTECDIALAAFQPANTGWPTNCSPRRWPPSPGRVRVPTSGRPAEARWLGHSGQLPGRVTERRSNAASYK